MIQIHDLTSEQVKLLNFIWEMDTEKEFADFVATLTQEKRLEVGTLIYLMMLSEIDEVVDNLDVPILAMAMLAKIGVKCHSATENK